MKYHLKKKKNLEIFKILIESEILKNLNKCSEIFNPGENNYSEFLKNDYVVDKTELILHINKIINSNITKNICVTRPRRFGKKSHKSTIHEGIEKIKKSIIDDVKMYDKHFKYCSYETQISISKNIYDEKIRYKRIKGRYCYSSESRKLKININPNINDVNIKEYTNKNAILTTLIQLGYLAYDSKNSSIYIPNKELIKEFEIVTEGDKYEAIYI
ncbi:hypothetical protein LY90DRAFT_518162 [Neocallimastix californiae]|uniref:AAA-ATPase-like domain-containing protein n=1 Tax=Neocallimastix californiae TaxID=1754190 RepID=A0A1Y1ZV61_9FUNG|nr:hypothetical protein LY90DRAFT_518162 [Neocallimastix californiae]|eukprot:ORY13665.1 hypothetical protein LY90DRAFT_518162 [Neocallimastix californiae]